MTEIVGSIAYTVSLDTGQLITGQRRVDASVKATASSLDQFAGKLTQTAQAARVHAQATTAAAAATKKAQDATEAASKAAAAAAATKAKADAAATEASKKSNEQNKKTSESLDKTAMSAKAMAAATRNIPAQFTDIVTSLQAGQSPLTVLMQQGGQLKDMFGGIGPAAKALGGYVLGLISPLTVGAAAAATFVVGLVKGQQEMTGFNKTLELGGNKAGVTASQLNVLASNMDGMAGVTRGKAADALTIFAAAGISGEKNLTKFTAAAIKLEQAGGPAVEDTAKAFADLGASPLQAALKLNSSVNFLTESLYKQIKSLQQQGKLTEAAKLAQNAYADAINSRTPKIMENLGLMERGWRAVANGAKEAWDAILNIGRTDTPAQALDATKKKLADLQKQVDSGGFATTAGGAAIGSGLSPQALAQKKAEIEALQEQVRQYGRAQSAAEGAAAADAKRAKTVQALADFDQAGEQFLSQRAQMEREITQARNMGVAAGKSDAEIQKRILDIRRNYSGLDAKSDAAQAYYQGLVAENAIALAKIDAAEKKELAENQSRMTQDWENAGVYQRARTEIVRKYAKERGVLEEKTTQDVAELTIAITSDEAKKIELIRDETFRRADAGVRLNVITHAQGEREKKRAAFEAEKDTAAMRERVAQTNADTAIQATVDELTRIELIRKEAIRRADAAGKAGMNSDQVSADKKRANVDATTAINAQLISIDPVAQLEKEYQGKLAIVQRYSELIGTTEVGGAELVAAKKAEIDRAYQLQRQLLTEQAFAAQSAGNAFLIDSLNTMSSTAAPTITGLLNGTASAGDAMKALGNVVLNDAVGALVQIGVQYLKNALISQTADKAILASKAANAGMYAAAVSAQVAVASSLAAANAFAATAAIPLVGPGLAPAAAAAAAAATAGLGAAAVAAAPLAGARRYGGPANSGSMYRVNESGEPEMFTAGNGQQYMLPTKSGNVTPANQVATGASAPTIIINNNNGSQVSQRYDQRTNTTEITIAEVARQIANNEGPIWNAMRQSGGARPSGL